MHWIVPKIWVGEDVWILGGGPSVTEQFEVPKEIVKDVIAKRLSPAAYSPYMSYLHDKHVIGINVAYTIGDWMDFIFFGDAPFFLKHQNQLSQIKPICVSCSQVTEKTPWVKYLAHDGGHNKGISYDNRLVSWNGNSGAAAISLAAHLGARRIFLLGFDMKLVDNSQHWHTLYRNNTNASITQPNPKSLPFTRHLSGFPAIKRDAEAMGIQIINVSPDSAIIQFKKVTLKDVINENRNLCNNKRLFGIRTTRMV